MGELHFKQIPTTKRKIVFDLDWWGRRTLMSIIHCFVCEPQSPEYKNHLLVAAMRLERISCLVYKSKDGRYHKLPAEKYKKEIFEGLAETSDEVADLISRMGKTVNNYEAEYIHKKIWIIADIVSSMISCMFEQGFIYEYAYAIDYVIKHDGDLEKPEMTNGLFPANYVDYNCSEGVTREFSQFLDV